MTYDISRILAGLPDISKMFTADGHELRRAGSTYFTRCPFHEEKSGSCKVDDHTGKFHCFGCGVGGDRIDYFRKSRGDMALTDALPILASMAGVTGDTHRAPQPTTRPAPAPAAKPLEPLTGTGLDEWYQATGRLLHSPREITRIAQWRGFSEDLLKWAAAEGLVGLFHWYGQWREAFLVEMAGQDEGTRLPVSVHIRLAPHTRGNDRDKASWRFAPTGCGSWPFVIGNLATAEHLFILEGQWDALALVDVMGWHLKWPANVAVVGLRGSTSTTKLLLHALNEKATAFVFADADGAGSRWFEEDGFLDRLHERVRRVHAFWPSEHGMDFNDLLKAGLITRDTLLAYLLPKMPKRRDRPSVTFLRWCRDQLTGEHAHAATHVLSDKKRPKGRRPATVWKRHWIKTGADPGLIQSLTAAFDAYRAYCRS